jgi:hypothetical protein
MATWTSIKCSSGQRLVFCALIADFRFSAGFALVAAGW